MPSYPATPWLVQPAAPVLVLGTVDQDRFLLSFHGVQESAYLRIPKLMPLLLTISLHGIGLVRQLKAARPIPNRREQNLRCRVYLVRAGILTSFPFAE